jgi:hypothetical protein
VPRRTADLWIEEHEKESGQAAKGSDVAHSKPADVPKKKTAKTGQTEPAAKKKRRRKRNAEEKRVLGPDLSLGQKDQPSLDPLRTVPHGSEDVRRGGRA